MVMARSRSKHRMRVGAFSNSSKAGCDSGNVAPFSAGTRTCSSAADSACWVISVRTTIGYCSPVVSLYVPTLHKRHRQAYGAIELRGLHA